MIYFDVSSSVDIKSCCSVGDTEVVGALCGVPELARTSGGWDVLVTWREGVDHKATTHRVHTHTHIHTHIHAHTQEMKRLPTGGRLQRSYQLAQFEQATCCECRQRARTGGAHGSAQTPAYGTASQHLIQQKHHRRVATTVCLSFHPMAKEHVHALKAWLAASVWLRLARLPPPASRVRRSRRLRDTLAAAPGLLAHACVTEAVKLCPMGPKLRCTEVL
jgi:hypothetical protein